MEPTTENILKALKRQMLIDITNDLIRQSGVDEKAGDIQSAKDAARSAQVITRYAQSLL